MRIIENTRNITEEEFRAERRKAVQATDTPKLMNLNKYAGALKVYQEKIGIESEEDFSTYMKDGQMLEPVLIERFKQETGLDSYHAPELHRMINRPLGCTIDGYCKENGELGLLEIKAVGQYSWDDWVSEPPPMYHMQVQHQLVVTGAPFAYLYAWSWGEGTRTFKILPDEKIHDCIYDTAQKFWNEYVIQKLPPLDSTYFATAEDLKALYPRAIALKEKFLSHESMAHIAEYKQCHDEIAELEKRKEAAKVCLQLELGEAERGIAPNGEIVNWPNVETPAIDSKKLKAENLELYNYYLKVRTSRRFCIGKERLS